MTRQEVSDVQDYMKKTGKRVQVLYGGNKRTLFYNSQREQFGMFMTRSRKRGVVFTDWMSIEKVFPVQPKESAQQYNNRVVRKYLREARKASFSNPFIRKALAADISKSPYENGLSTGVKIEGDLVSLDRLDKLSRGLKKLVLDALASGANLMHRFDFNGYDGTVEIAWRDGEPHGFLSKEYRNCGNGYYYLLVNEQYFIGYDID